MLPYPKAARRGNGQFPRRAGFASDFRQNLQCGLLAMVLVALFASRGLAAAPVLVTGAWARATAPGQTIGAAYMSLTSVRGDTLAGASSPDADMAMLHKTSRHGGMSGMEDVDELDLPPGQTVTLAPNGLHVMLMGLKHPLVAGQTVRIDLTFKEAGIQHVSVPVQPLRASGPPR